MKLKDETPISSATDKQRQTLWTTAVFVLILLLAAGLRFYKLDAQSFWNDEGNSARLSERAIPLIIEGTASDIHPPLYYLLLRGWREPLGEHEFGLRSFSAFAGVLTVAAAARLGREFFVAAGSGKQDNRWGWLLLPAVGAFWAAVNPALVYYSQETRMYALLALITAVSTIFMLTWLRGGRWGWAVAYLLTITAGLYAHYFFPAVILLQNLYLLLDLIRSRNNPAGLKRPLPTTLLTWAGLMAAAFLFYLPWLPIFLRQTGGRAGVREPLLLFLWESARWLAFGETISPGDVIWPTAAVIGLLLLALLVGRRRAVWPTLGTAVPVLFMYAAGTTEPAFFKFMLTAVPFYCVWLAATFFSFRTGWSKRLWAVFMVISLGLSGVVLWATAVSLNNLYSNPAFARADYRSMAARIAADNHPNAAIILNAPNQWEVFTYYHRDGAPVYPLPKGQPDPAILEPQLAEIAAAHDRIYAVFWGEAQRDPQRVVERWLDANAFKAAEEWIGDVRFVVYAAPDSPPTEMESPAAVQFGDAILLNGYTLQSTQLAPGDVIQVTLFWETAVPLDTRYKIFLHLLDDDGQLVAQQDSEPGGGLGLTTTWQPGEEIVDNHGLLLPHDLPSGNYTLVMGLYDVDDPAARLPLKSQEPVTDSWQIAVITIP